MFCYTTGSVSVRTETGPSNFDPMRCNAVKCYMEHYQNHLVLTHISNTGTITEKAQAKRELEICQRKMAYWARQPHFVQEEALRQKERLHKRMSV